MIHKAFIAVWIFTLMAGMLSGVKFNATDFANADQVAKKYVQSKLGDLAKNNVKRVIITDCTGAFTISKTTTPGAWESVDMPLYKKQEKTLTTTTSFNQEFIAYESTRVYELVKSMLEKAGLEVLPMEAYTNHEIYQQMSKYMEASDEDTQRKNSYLMQSQSSRTLKVPAQGLRLYPDNIMSMLKIQPIVMNKGKILVDNDAQAFVRIGYGVDASSSGKPILQGFSIEIDTGIKSYATGKKDKDGNKEMISQTTKTNFLALKAGETLNYQGEVFGDKKYLDPAKFDAALMEMISALMPAFEQTLTTGMGGK